MTGPGLSLCFTFLAKGQREKVNAKRDAMRCDEMSKMANGRKSTNKEAKANKQIQNGMSKGAGRGVLRGDGVR